MTTHPQHEAPAPTPTPASPTAPAAAADAAGATSPVIVVAPRSVAAGFALAGASTLVPSPPTDLDRHDRPEHGAASQVAVSAVEEAVHVVGQDAVVLVHHSIWRQVPVAVQDTWAERTDVLVVALPSDEGDPHSDHQGHQDQLTRLLSRAVGYEISFVPEGGPA